MSSIIRTSKKIGKKTHARNIFFARAFVFQCNFPYGIYGILCVDLGQYNLTREESQAAILNNTTHSFKPRFNRLLNLKLPGKKLDPKWSLGWGIHFF